jgi:hypothetical protein
MYMIFAMFNGLALIHMFLCAPETKGRTLEEMDDVFDSGVPAWKKVEGASRLDQLRRDIEKGHGTAGSTSGPAGESNLVGRRY